MDVVDLNSADHILEQVTATDVHSTDGADVAQGIQNLGLALGVTGTEEADDTDNALELDGLDTLLQSAGSTDFQNVIDTLSVRGQLAGRLTPLGVLLVVEDMVGSELLQERFLFRGGGGSNNGGTGSLGELWRKAIVSM